ncbi:MAG: TetR/AcrR family transcriptional regulator [Acidobacteriota bacterium]
METARAMRYSPEHKAKTRKSILDAASRVFRRRGYQGGGVDAVMKEAGLTHGGFYAHFRSKEALLAETVLESMLDVRKRHRDWTEGTSGSTWLRRFLDHYLSDRHRRHSDRGCPVPTLVSELDRVGDTSKASFEKGLEIWARDIAEQLGDGPQEERRRKAFGVVAACVGGVAVARAVADPRLAEDVLRGARELAMEAAAESPAPGSEAEVAS